LNMVHLFNRLKISLSSMSFALEELLSYFYDLISVKL